MSIKDVVVEVVEEAVVHPQPHADVIVPLMIDLMIETEEVDMMIEEEIEVEEEEEVDHHHHLYQKKNEIEELSLFLNWLLD